MPKQPALWPANVEYIATPRTSRGLSTSEKQRYCCALPPPSSASNAIIRKITDPNHPACGQFGLFAARNIQGREWIIDYIGLVHLESESDLSSDYDLSLERTSDFAIGIDAAQFGNEARMINDYRGTGAQRHNAEFQIRVVNFQGVERVRMAIFAGKQGIAKGQEILVSYGKGFWQARNAEETTI